MNQTLALLLDAYRELNAKRMFWIVLVISGLVVLAFCMIGVTNDPNAYSQHITLMGVRTPLPALLSRAAMFKLAFTSLGIKLWLTWVAMILAIISTSSMFPDLMTGGSIDLYLCKPISRLRLFLTKYAAGLLFVGLQVTAFSAASFVVIGWRGGSWEPRIFLAVPLVVSTFSYLWCLSVLLGVKTRSTLAAALLTMIAWLLIAGVDQTETVLLMVKTHSRQVVEGYDIRLKTTDAQAKAARISLAATQPTTQETDHVTNLETRWQRVQAERAVDAKTLKDVSMIHTIAYRLKTMLPKTRETNELLDRSLLSRDELHELDESQDQRRRGPAWTAPEVFAEAKETIRSRSVGWIMGTSFIFELVVMTLAARSFCRRDF